MKKILSKKSQFWLTSISILVFIIGLLSSILYQRYQLTQDVLFQATLDSNCDLKQNPCTSTIFQDGSITFSISPSTIPLLEPLVLDVSVKGFEFDSARIVFVGLNMDMGLNQAKLKKIEKVGDITKLRGNHIIPICIKDKMEWEARVILSNKEGNVMAPFRFTTIKKP